MKRGTSQKLTNDTDSHKERILPMLNRAINYVSDFYNTKQMTNWLLEEVKRKKKQYPFFRKKVLFLHTSWKKRYKYAENNPNFQKVDENFDFKKIISYYYEDPKFLSRSGHYCKSLYNNFQKLIPKNLDFKSKDFFKKKFNEVLSYFLCKIFPFSEKRLNMDFHIRESFSDLFFRYEYKISDGEFAGFTKIKQEMKLNESVNHIIELFFTYIISVAGEIIKEIINDNFYIELMCAIYNLDENSLRFNICIRKKDITLNTNYFITQLYHFSEVFSQIPKEIKERLSQEKELIYLVALKRYNSIKPSLISTLDYIHEKCITLKSIIPLMDLFNFIFSRVEDSNITSDKLIDNFLLENYKDIQDEQFKILKYLISIINKNAVLFSTFQSNNRSTTREQYQLFMLLLQYFIGQGISIEEYQSRFFFPTIYNLNKNNLYDKNAFFKKFENTIEKFVMTAFSLSLYPDSEIFIKKLIGIDIRKFNEDFIKCFAYSFQVYLIDKLRDSNLILKKKKISFDNLVEIIISILKYALFNIFISDPDPLKSSMNFRDRMGRYSPRKLALRTLEILIFKETPISDRIWQNFTLSINKNKVKQILGKYLTIPDDFFYSNKKIIDIISLYKYGLVNNMLLEVFITDFFLKPMFLFLNETTNALKNSISNDLSGNLNQITIKKKLSKLIYDRVSMGIIDDHTLENLEDLSDWFSTTFAQDFQEILRSEI